MDRYCLIRSKLFSLVFKVFSSLAWSWQTFSVKDQVVTSGVVVGHMVCCPYSPALVVRRQHGWVDEWAWLCPGKHFPLPRALFLRAGSSSGLPGETVFLSVSVT